MTTDMMPDACQDTESLEQRVRDLEVALETQDACVRRLEERLGAVEDRMSNVEHWLRHVLACPLPSKRGVL